MTEITNSLYWVKTLAMLLSFSTGGCGVPEAGNEAEALPEAVVAVTHQGQPAATATAASLKRVPRVSPSDGPAASAHSSEVVNVTVRYRDFWLTKNGNDHLCFTVPHGSWVTFAELIPKSSIGNGAYLWAPSKITDLVDAEEGDYCINVRWWKNPGYWAEYSLRIQVSGSGYSPQVVGSWDLPGNRPMQVFFVGDAISAPTFYSNQG